MWWLLGTLAAVVGVAGILVLGNKRQQRRALRGLSKRVKTRVAAPPKPARAASSLPSFTTAPNPQVMKACVARGCYESKSPKKDCKCPCKGELHGTGRPGRKAACAAPAASGPVSTRWTPGPRGTTMTATRIETALRSHVQSNPKCSNGTVSRRTFGDGRVTYTCNTCKMVLAS